MTLMPLYVGYVDDNDEATTAWDEWIARINADAGAEVLRSHTYTTATHVAKSAEKHDVWLVDIDLGPGRQWQGVEVLVDLLSHSGAHAVILWSAKGDRIPAFEPFRRPGAPFRFFEKSDRGGPDEFRTLLAEELRGMRQQWIDGCRLVIDKESIGPDDVVVVSGRGMMTMRQLFVDAILQGSQGTESEWGPAYINDNLLVRYFCALQDDPSTVGAQWNTEHERLSLINALGHQRLTPGSGIPMLAGRKVPSNQAELCDILLADLGRFSLRAQTNARARAALTNAVTGPSFSAASGKWQWTGWESFKSETSLDLVGMLKEMARSCPDRIRLEGAALTDCNYATAPRTFVETHAISRHYFCERTEIQLAIGGLIQQLRDDQAIALSMSGKRIGADRAEVVLIGVVTPMVLQPMDLHASTVDTTAGRGFRQVWDNSRGYGRWFVRSNTWDSWWDPLLMGWHSDAVSFPELPSINANQTCFALRMLAPWSKVT